MKEFKCGISGKASLKADKSVLAVNVGSGSLEVFATPMMIMLMEKAACSCLSEYLENDETTVGTELNVKHTSASPEDSDIYAVAELIDVNGRELTFKVEAYDNAGSIGIGTHKRFIVFGERFTAKTMQKLNK